MKREEEIGIRRYLKRRVSINEAVFVLFLITGGIIFSATALGSQELTLGQGTVARGSQSTAIGNDTYALGYSSIALGTDDAFAENKGYGEAISKYDYENYFKYLYGRVNGAGEGIDPSGTKYGFVEANTNSTAHADSRKYSPTLSRGIGSISIGSRSVAFDKGAVSIGTLSFALKEGATSLGTKTRAEGIGAMALGNLSNVFADYSVATGNSTQVLKEGGMAYGYQAYSAGQGALAIGREVSANAQLTNLAEIKAAFEKETTNIEELKAAGDKAKFIEKGTVNGVTGIVKQNTDKNYAIVVGNRAAATSENSLAIGRSAFSLADNSVAIGSLSYADAANAMAIGVGARVYDLTKEGHTGISALAIGKGSLATLENSVALGVDSRTDYSVEDLKRAGYAPKGSLAIPTTEKTGVISVGRKGAERRISNIATGYLNTDAVNVGQLKALEDTINLNISEKTGGGVKYVSTNKTGGDSKVLEGKLNTKSDYASYIEHVALKKTLELRKNLNKEELNEESMKKISDEIDRLKELHPDFASLENISSIDSAATGNPTEDAKRYSALLEEVDKKKREALEKVPEGAKIDNYHNADNSGAKGADSVAIGYDAATSETAINAVAIGKTATVNAAQGIAIGDTALVSAGAQGGIAIGNHAMVTENTVDSVAIGKNSKTTGNSSEGYKILENIAVSSTSVSAYYPWNKRATVFSPNSGEFAIGSGETKTRRLTGLAAGKEDTDAVNVAQYKALAGFSTRIVANTDVFNRALASSNTLHFIGEGDIQTTAKVDATKKEDKIIFSLNKLTTVNEENKESAQVATTKAVYTAIKDAKTSVVAGTDGIIEVNGNKTNDIAGNTFTLGINKTKLQEALATDFAKKDASNIAENKEKWVNALSGENGFTKTSEYKNATGIDADTWKEVLGVSNIDLHYKGNGDTDSKTVALSTGLNIQGEKSNATEVSGKNIWVESAEGGNLKIKMAEKPEFTEVKTGANTLNAVGLTVGGSKITSNAITASEGTLGGIGFKDNQTTALKAATQAGNAVEYKQFTDAIAGALGNNSHFNVRDDGGAVYKVELSKNPNLFIKGAETDETSSGGTKIKNIKTSISGENILIDLNDTINVKGASIAGVTFINKDGKKEIHAGDAKITNLADGEVKEGSRAAVNGGQLWTVNKIATEAKTLAGEAKIAADSAQGTATEALGKANTNTGKIAENTSAIAGHTKTIADHANLLTSHTSSIHDNKTAIEKGFLFSAEKPAVVGEADKIKRNLGESLTIVGDEKNLSTTIDSTAKVVVSLKDSPKFGKITINDSGKITGLSNGTAESDAITLSQLKPIASAVNATVGADGAISAPKYTIGEKQHSNIQDAFNDINTKASGKITFKDGSTNTKEVGLGEAISFKGDSKNLNVNLNATNGIYNFSIVDNPTFKGVVTGNGFNANNQKITNVASGSTDFDAVNYKQLQEVKAGLTSAVSLTLEAPVTYIAKVAGTETIVKKIGNHFYKPGDLDTNGQPKPGTSPIDESALKTVKVAALAKDGGISDKIRFTNVAAGDISDKSTDVINGSQLKPVLDALAMTWDADNNTIHSPTWKIGKEEFHNIPAVIKGMATGKVGSLVLTNELGENIVRATNGNMYKLSDIDEKTFEAKPSATPVEIKDIRYSVLNTVASDGATTTPMQIGNVAAGTKPKDAVNLEQLTKLGLDPNAAVVKPVVTYDGNDKGTITLAGKDEDGNNIGSKITNLADGALAAGSKDAVTGNQLYKVDEAIKELKKETDKGWNLGVNTEAASKVSHGDTVQITSDDNLAITSTLSGTTRTLNITTKDSPTFGKIKLENKGDNSTITGLTNISWNKDKITTGRAATEDQLKSAVEAINTSSSNADKFAVKYGEKDGNPDYTTVSLKNPYNSEDNTGGTKIKNLARGDIKEKSSDAINGSQLYATNKVLADAISPNAFDLNTGMLKNNLVFPSVSNNGTHSNVNSITAALENLRYGFRIFGGKGPIGDSLDTIAGATSVGNKENLAILGDKNISTSVTRKKIVVTRIVDGIEKKDTMSTPILSIAMSDTPSFKSVTATESISVGDSKNSDENKRAVIAINSEGKGYIDGLKNKSLNKNLSELNKDNLETLSISAERAATEGQLSEVIKDYIKRDDDNVKYDSSTKDKVTFNSKNTNGVILTNIAEAKEGKDAVNLDLLKTYSKERFQAVANVIGTTVDENGKVIKPTFTEIDGKTPTSIKDALDKLGNKITTGTEALEGIVGTGSDGRDGKTGTSGTTGPTGKDRLQGEDLTTKVNALRNGEAGPVVYTDATGERLYKGNDGKYYKADNIDFATGKATGNPVEPVRLSLVNPDGTTIKSLTVLSNLANGTVVKDSHDAITGDQLHKVASVLGTVTEDGTLTLNKMKFAGNIDTLEHSKTLGQTVSILGNKTITKEQLSNYTEENVVTENTADGILIKFSKTPEFTSMKAAEKVTIGDDGIVLNGKDGNNSIAFKNNTGAITGLKDLGEGSDASSAVNKKFVDDEIKKVTNTINTGNAALAGKVGDPGKDATDGRNGNLNPDGTNSSDGKNGPAGQDGLNGKDINSKANALRRGEAGIIVYTKEDGTRVGKATDGRYYELSKIHADGSAEAGATALKAKEIRHSLVSADDGTTTTQTALSNLANGKIKKDSSDAITGDQLQDFADKIGLKVKASEATKLQDPEFTPLKDKFVKDASGDIYKKEGDKYYKLDTTTGEFAKDPIGYKITGEKDVEPKLVDRINLLSALNNQLQNDLKETSQKGLVFRGDNAVGTEVTETRVPLGEALNIKGGTVSHDVEGVPYIGGNIRVESSPKGIEIYTKANPTFDTITLNKEGLEKTSAVRLDQLNALRRELNLNLITKSDPDGNGIVGDQRDPKGAYPDIDPSPSPNPNPNPGVPSTGGSITNNVNALTKGEAGPIVYTTETGERVVLAADKNFYKAEDLKGKIYHDNKWYDASKVKESNGKLYDIKTGEEIKADYPGIAAPTKYSKDIKLSAVDGKNNSTTPSSSMALGNIADGSAGKDATNVDQMNKLREELGLAAITPEDKNGDGKADKDPTKPAPSGTTGPTGPTGATGGVGNTGAAEKDGVAEGKLSDKVEYLRDGYAGTVVYTDEAGDRIVKGKDNNYYKAKDVNDKVYVDGKWYDKSTFEKYDVKDGKWVDKGKDTLSSAAPKALSIDPLKNVKPELSLVDNHGDTSTKDGVVLKNVGKGKVSSDSTEAVNGSQLHDVYEAIKNTGEGQLIDGRDGKAGIDKSGNVVADSAGSKGNTSKDHLNRTSATTKANALRNGEAGTLVYTNETGDRLFKGNDGKYYKFADLESNGNPKKDAKAAEKVVSTAVQYDGTTDKPGIVRVGDGKVSEDSKEAVNGSQLHDTNTKIDQIASQSQAKFEAHERAIAENTQRIEKLDTKVNKGLANAAAMSGITFMDIGVNQASVAAAVGGYKGTQAVAVGVQAAPTENVRVNAKVSMTPGSQSEGMYSVGAAYRFNFR